MWSSFFFTPLPEHLLLMAFFGFIEQRSMRTLSEVDITNRLKKWWYLIFAFRVSLLHHSFAELLVKFSNLKSCALWTNVECVCIF